MTVIDAVLTKSFAPDLQLSLFMTTSSVAGFAMALLPFAEPYASAKAVADAASDAIVYAPADGAAAVAAAVAAARAANAAADEAADAVAGTNLRLLRAMLLQLTPVLLKAAEQHCSANGQKPLDLRDDKLPKEGCILAMLRRAVGGVACDEAGTACVLHPPAACCVTQWLD
jgi:hypothetical protein